jgi:Schlafen, AlbA_2
VADPPACPFGPAWEDLRLADVRSFLKSDPPERASWEAKQHTTKGELANFVRKECCAFANRNGGYLLLGAEDQKGAGWVLSGIDVSGVKEIHDWIASLLRQLTPVPPFDVHEWGLGGTGRKLVIVQVAPAPLPPVSVGSTVYIRHGSQTIRADGPAIRRLSQQGQKAEERVVKKTRKRTKELAEQIFVPFALGIGRSGGRAQALSDTTPQQVAYARLKEVLEARWRKRKLTKLVWAERQKDLLEYGLEPQRNLGYDGWRAAWQMRDVAQDERARVAFKRRAERFRPGKSKPRVGGPAPSPGDDDLWTVHLDTDAVAIGTRFHLPVGTSSFDAMFGRGALADGEMLLRALVRIELDLGAEPDEPVFVCLALRNPWGREATVYVESWNDLSVKPSEWRTTATTEAARKMHLEKPPTHGGRFGHA